MHENRMSRRALLQAGAAAVPALAVSNAVPGLARQRGNRPNVVFVFGDQA